MSFESLQTWSQIALLVGAILGALGTFGHFYFGQQIERERTTAAAIHDQETFRRSLYFRQLRAYWIAVGPDTYQLGLVADILNKDATRALVFESVRFEGGFTLSAESGGFLLQSMALYNAKATVEGQYYLNPGKETAISMLLPSKVQMKIMPGGKPGLRLSGSWTFMFENTPFALSPATVAVIDVLSVGDWQKQAQR